MKLLLVIILSTIVSVTHASEQTPDTIGYKGETYSIEPFILEQYFAKHPNIKPEGYRLSDLNRGYVASFTVTNDHVVLTDVKIRWDESGQYLNGGRSIKNEIFPHENSFTLEWFSGVLILGKGDRVRCKRTGCKCIFSDYVILEVHEGKITREKRLKAEQFEPFMDAQFEAFKKSPKGLDIIQQMKSTGFDDPENHLYLRVLFREHMPIIKIHDATNSPNQKLQPTVTTPVESGTEQGTAAEL